MLAACGSLHQKLYTKMSTSFLPAQYAHPYEIDPKYSKSVAYFCMEYAIDNVFKIYSGGLGYLAGSHMRSAGALRQNLVGVGILWSYGYYNQIRAEDGSMAVISAQKIQLPRGSQHQVPHPHLQLTCLG